VSFLVLPFEKGDICLTSVYGWRTLNGQRDFHRGVDLVGSGRVIAAAGGRVAVSTMVTDRSNLTWQWGNYVRVDDAAGRRFYYCHLKSRFVKPGQEIRAGDHIGLMGSTGYSFGAHLHFEVRDSGGNSLNAAELLGIENKPGVISQPDFRARVLELCGFGDDFAKYLDKYRYSDAVWRKIFTAIQKGGA